jgi:amino acid transporter
MNLWSVAALGIGSMVGAGIFALLGQAALVAGGETYLAFIIGGVIAGMSGYSYARLAARYPKAGGIAAYFDAAFGTRRLSGTLTLIYLVTLAVTIAMIASAFGAYAAPLFVGSSDPFWTGLFASAIVVLLTALNVGGAGLVGPAELLLVVVKLVILSGLMLAGITSRPAHLLTEHVHPGVLGLLASVGLTFFAYAGYGMMANAAASVANPQRTIPRSIFLAIAVVTMLYVGLAIVVLQSISPADLVAHADTAVAQAAEPVLGHAGFIAVSIAALLATASAINATLFSAVQIASALVQTDRLPKAFDRHFWRHGTQGVMISIGAILLMVNFFDLNAIANIASATFLISYLAVYVAHWWLVPEAGGSRPIIIFGIISMGLVLLVFLWSVSRTQPWSIAMIAVFVVGSAVVQSLLHRTGPHAAELKRTPGIS